MKGIAGKLKMNYKKCWYYYLDPKSDYDGLVKIKNLKLHSRYILDINPGYFAGSYFLTKREALESLSKRLKELLDEPD